MVKQLAYAVAFVACDLTTADESPSGGVKKPS